MSDPEIREIFAAIALHGLASAPRLVFAAIGEQSVCKPEPVEPEKMAREAVALADALIKALAP
jgi:hypothetical protein